MSRQAIFSLTGATDLAPSLPHAAMTPARPICSPRRSRRRRTSCRGGWRSAKRVRRLGDAAGAAAAFTRVLALDPDDHCGAALLLARLGSREPRTAMSLATCGRCSINMPDASMRRWRPAFNMSAPAGLRAAVEAARPGAFSPTCSISAAAPGSPSGVAYDRAARLTGVDLSPAMIRQARRQAIYHRLETGELMAFLGRRARPWLGLRPCRGGRRFRLCFRSCARGGGRGASFKRGRPVRFHGRNLSRRRGRSRRHAPLPPWRSHVRAALAAADLRPIVLSPVATRVEAAAAVPGLLSLPNAIDTPQKLKRQELKRQVKSSVLSRCVEFRHSSRTCHCAVACRALGPDGGSG